MADDSLFLNRPFDERAFEERVSEALRIWADRHPRPRQPVVVTAEGRVFTPAELAREVEQRTEFGRQHLSALRLYAATSRAGPQGLIDMYLEAAKHGDDSEEARMWLRETRGTIDDGLDSIIANWNRTSSTGLLTRLVDAFRRGGVEFDNRRSRGE